MSQQAALVERQELVTAGQASLANGCGQEFCHHTYMASLRPEGEEAREDHIEKARDELRRAAKFLGMKVVANG